MLAGEAQQWREQLREVMAQRDGVGPAAASRSNVHELLDGLDGRGCLNLTVRHRGDQATSRVAQGVVCALGAYEDRGVEDDHARRARNCSSSVCRSAGSGTGMSAASSRRLAAE